jgi:hypothetical protein
VLLSSKLFKSFHEVLTVGCDEQRPPGAPVDYWYEHSDVAVDLETVAERLGTDRLTAFAALRGVTDVCHPLF